MKNTGKEAARRANSCQRGRISHLEMGRTDRGIMKLLTSKQAAESWADGEGATRLGCEAEDQPEASWILREKKNKKKKEKWPVEAARVLFVGWPAVHLHVKSESQLTGRALPSKY